MGRYLTERASYPHSAPVLGVVEYRRDAEAVTLMVLHGYVPNQGTAWQYALDELSRFFERMLAQAAGEPQEASLAAIKAAAERAVTPSVQEQMGHFLDEVALLGRRTGELHEALAAEREDPAFVPEPFTQLYQRSVYQSLRNLQRRAFDRLQATLARLPEWLHEETRALLGLSDRLLERFRLLLGKKMTGQRIRCHGDYNLSEVLYTGKDFVTIDFEGDGARSLSDRRVKRSALRDVASMVRSFHYAATGALIGGGAKGQAPGVIRRQDQAVLEPWARTWYGWVTAAFLQAYLGKTQGAAFLPQSAEEFWLLLGLYLLEKGLMELYYELTNRLDWAVIPIRGLLALLRP